MPASTPAAAGTGITVKSIKLNYTSVSIDRGGTLRLKATVRGMRGRVRWKSSNSRIVSVSNGLLKAKRVGKATITARIGGRKVACKVKVEKPVSYAKRQKTALKNLLRHIRTVEARRSPMYWPGKTSVSAGANHIRRKGRYLTCDVYAAIGGGCLQGGVKVDLKTGLVSATWSDGLFPVDSKTRKYTFKIKVK